MNWQQDNISGWPANPVEAGLSANLFWDADIAQLDFERNRRLVAERVIQRGSYKELCLIKAYYGKERLAEIIKTIAYLEPKDISFVHHHFRIPLNELKCYTKRPFTGNSWI